MSLLFRYIALALITAVLVLSTSGCGQKGPLYLPDEPELGREDIDDDPDPIY